MPSFDSLSLRKIASELVNSLDKSGIHSIFLFGSAAWGDADPSSDIDLMIINYHKSVIKYAERLEYKGVFVDISSTDLESFKLGVEAGEFSYRLLNCLILYDPNGHLAAIYKSLMTSFYLPNVQKARLLSSQKEVEDNLRVSQESAKLLDIIGVIGAISSGYSALTASGCALINAMKKRPSSNHYIVDLKNSAANVGRPDLYSRQRELRNLGISPKSAMIAIESCSEFRALSEDFIFSGQNSKKLPAEKLFQLRNFSFSESSKREIQMKLDYYKRREAWECALYYVDTLCYTYGAYDLGPVMAFLRGEKEMKRKTPLIQFISSLSEYKHLFEKWLIATRLAGAEEIDIKIMDKIESLSKETLKSAWKAIEA